MEGGPATHERVPRPGLEQARSARKYQLRHNGAVDIFCSATSPRSCRAWDSTAVDADSAWGLAMPNPYGRHTEYQLVHYGPVDIFSPHAEHVPAFIGRGACGGYSGARAGRNPSPIRIHASRARIPMVPSRDATMPWIRGNGKKGERIPIKPHHHLGRNMKR